MKVCPSCGADNTDDALYCEDCGAQLPTGEEATGAREGPLSEGTRVHDHYIIDKALYGCSIHRYLATTDTKSRHFLLEGPEGDPGLLAEQKKRLDDVDHPSVWRPQDGFRWENRDYLVGPLPALQTVAQQIEKEGPMAWMDVLELGITLASYLARLHEAHLLSLSIQPERIWRDAEDVMVDAYGRIKPKGSHSESFEVTSGFSPPECYGMQGGQPDERSDIFSLGALLHYCLTGCRTDLESRDTFFAFAPPRVEAPQAFLDVIMKSVSKKPEARYPDAQTFFQALEASENGSPPMPTTVLPAVPEPSRPPSPPGGVSGAIQVAMLSNIGCVRSVNQDACLELRFSSVEKDRNRDAHLVAVIDGMGGEAEGDKAASLALRAIAQEVVTLSLALRNGRHTSPLLPDDSVAKNRYIIQRALECANRTIHDYASLDTKRQGMGCTVTAALLDGGTAVFGHVGDTRAYLYRRELDQITTDHSLVGRLVEMGQMTPEEARNSPQRSIIYRAMGTNPEVEVDVYERKLQPGDYLMMSSDGVWEYFEQGELTDIFHRYSDPNEICQHLVRICLDRGADDNATVAVVHVLP